MTYEQLADFVQNRMRMSHVYQPVMLMTLLRQGGRRSTEEIAKAILAHDESQVEYYEDVTKNMVGRVLRRHSIVEKQNDDYVLVAKLFTVFNYDRRGRGDSRDTTPYAVKREIEDIGALVAEAGGTASVYGHSSGAGLVLHAAAHGLPITKIVLHDPPYAPEGDEEARRASREYGKNLEAMLSEDRHGDAVELFMGLVGMPQEMVEGMRRTPRLAGLLEAMAPTLAYDSQVMGDIGRDGTIPVEQVGRVTVPALVLTGGADYPWMIDVGRRLAEAMPNGRHRVLEGQEHSVPPEVLVPVLAEFFAD